MPRFMINSPGNAMTVSGLLRVRITLRHTLMDILRNLNTDVFCVKKGSNGDNNLNAIVKMTTPDDYEPSALLVHLTCNTLSYIKLLSD